MNSITQFLKIGDIVRVKSKVQAEITGWYGAIAWVTNEDPARYEISFFAPRKPISGRYYDRSEMVYITNYNGLEQILMSFEMHKARQNKLEKGA